MRDSPEVLRRARDRTKGRRRYRCRTIRHRARVWWLSRRHPTAELDRRLIRMAVRLDPPAFARVCSCEEPRTGPAPQQDQPWPGEVFADRGRWAFRCGIDGCEMNGTGYATQADAERRLRTHGATETCPYTYERAAAPHDKDDPDG